ncbi:MAG TPA: hypothetical protein VII58_07245 [Acidobacteriaceae bacterium]
MASAAAQAQSTLPPAGATVLAPSTSAYEAPAAPPVARQAQVSYQMGQLTVITQNSSLEAILRDIAAKTGMKITGSIADERVYGTYGPAAPSSVLARLLDGSGNDMVLRESAAGPVELVLTPAQPMAAARAPYAPPAISMPPTPPMQSRPQPNYYPPSPPQSYQPPPQQPPQYMAQPQPVYSQPSGMGQPVSAPDEASPSGASMPQSPNGVRTPQQIYEQLQRLQQQKAQPPGSPQ